MVIQIIQQNIRHDLDAYDQTLFVNVEVRSVPACGYPSGLVADAQKVVEAGRDFLKVRKIFCGHEWFYSNYVLLANDAAQCWQSFVNKARLVVCDRSVLVK